MAFFFIFFIRKKKFFSFTILFYIFNKIHKKKCYLCKMYSHAEVAQ